MSRELTPIPATSTGYPDGAYVLAAVTFDEFGSRNADANLDLNSDASDADKLAKWDRAVDAVEGYVDTQAKLAGLAADADAATGRMIGPANAYYARIRHLASLDMIPQLYQARGVIDGTTGPEGQMTALRKEVRDELKEILANLAAGATEVSGGIDGISVIGPATNGACCGSMGCGGIW